MATILALSAYNKGDSDERPWGSWEVIHVGPSYAVKRIVVAAGARLSLQYHNHRSECWVAVEGDGEAEVSGVKQRFSVGDVVHIPTGTTHRVSAGRSRLVFFEVQFGDRLEEKDIVRLADDYGRAASLGDKTNHE